MELKKFVSVAMAGVALVGLPSCQSHDEPQVQNEESAVEMSPLAEILASTVESHDNGTPGDSYIVYDASTGHYTAMTADEYALVNAFADILAPEDQATRAPQGRGWIKGGSGKGKAAAIKVAMKLMNTLDQQRDFEVHVEYGDNGSFTVWYRYI